MNEFGKSNANPERKMEIKPIQEEFSKIFHENRLGELSNGKIIQNLTVIEYYLINNSKRSWIL